MRMPGASWTASARSQPVVPGETFRTPDTGFARPACANGLDPGRQTGDEVLPAGLAFDIDDDKEPTPVSSFRARSWRMPDSPVDADGAGWRSRPQPLPDDARLPLCRPSPDEPVRPLTRDAPGIADPPSFAYRMTPPCAPRVMRRSAGRPPAMPSATRTAEFLCRRAGASTIGGGRGACRPRGSRPGATAPRHGHGACSDSGTGGTRSRPRRAGSTPRAAVPVMRTSPRPGASAAARAQGEGEARGPAQEGMDPPHAGRPKPAFRYGAPAGCASSSSCSRRACGRAGCIPSAPPPPPVRKGRGSRRKHVRMRRRPCTHPAVVRRGERGPARLGRTMPAVHEATDGLRHEAEGPAKARRRSSRTVRFGIRDEAGPSPRFGPRTPMADSRSGKGRPGAVVSWLPHAARNAPVRNADAGLLATRLRGRRAPRLGGAASAAMPPASVTFACLPQDLRRERVPAPVRQGVRGQSVRRPLRPASGESRAATPGGTPWRRPASAGRSTGASRSPACARAAGGGLRRRGRRPLPGGRCAPGPAAQDRGLFGEARPFRRARHEGATVLPARSASAVTPAARSATPAPGSGASRAIPGGSRHRRAGPRGAAS